MFAYRQHLLNYAQPATLTNTHHRQIREARKEYASGLIAVGILSCLEIPSLPILRIALMFGGLALYNNGGCEEE